MSDMSGKSYPRSYRAHILQILSYIAPVFVFLLTIVGSVILAMQVSVNSRQSDLADRQDFLFEKYVGFADKLSEMGATFDDKLLDTVQRVSSELSLLQVANSEAIASVTAIKTIVADLQQAAVEERDSRAEFERQTSALILQFTDLASRLEESTRMIGGIDARVISIERSGEATRRIAEQNKNAALANAQSAAALLSRFEAQDMSALIARAVSATSDEYCLRSAWNARRSITDVEFSDSGIEDARKAYMSISTTEGVEIGDGHCGVRFLFSPLSEDANDVVSNRLTILAARAQARLVGLPELRLPVYFYSASQQAR